MKRKNFIKPLLILLILFIVILLNCTAMTESSLAGSWQIIKVLSTQSDGDLSDLTYDFDSGKITVLDSRQNIYQLLNYTMTSNVIKINGSSSTESILANETYNVYYSGNQMIWYLAASGIESYRFLKNR
jgi:hypothetical protein